MAERPNDLNNRDLRTVVILVAAALVIFHLGLAARGRGLSRDQHLGTAVAYAKGHIDLLRPVVLGANANGAPTPLEFPLWQALTALLMKGFGGWYGWGNVVSLLCQLSAVWPLFELARRLFSERTAWWALIFYLAQPFTFLWGGMASADSLPASLTVWFVYFCFRMMADSDWRWWPVAAMLGCLSAITKAPFFMTVGLAMFFWLLYAHGRSTAAWLQLASVGTMSLVVFAAWNHHANQCYDAAEFAFIDLRLGKSPEAFAWWFGDWAYRLNPWNWAKGAWRMLTVLLGSFGLIFLPLAGFRLPDTMFLRLWLLAGACTVAVFTHVVLIHLHYYAIFAPVVALLCARAAAELEPVLWERLRLGLLARVCGLSLLIAVSLAQGLEAAHLRLFLDPHMTACARLINEHTAPTDKLLAWDAEWTWTGPLLRCDRPGLSIHVFDAVNEPAKLARLKELGYNKLVLMNPSELLVAITTASGSGLHHLKDLSKEVPPVAKDWPVVFSSPSVLILDIPR